MGWRHFGVLFVWLHAPTAVLAFLLPLWFGSGDVGRQQHVLGPLGLESSGNAADSLARQALPFPRHPSRPTTGFVALGDSYSAGIGTGVEGKEDECRHGVHAYPMLIHEDLSADKGPNSTSLQFLSCTGAVTEDILSGGTSSQIDDFNTTVPADFAMLSIGGNDLGFFEVINSCIFRFYSYYSGTCEAALENADKQIQSDEFANRLRVIIMEILDKVQWEKQPWFTVTVTGYARFFNTDTEECDQCSMGVWWHGPKLKRDTRLRMNDMVLAVNDKIRGTIEDINAGFVKPRVLFIDYDAKFEGHRFCEPNITEPDYNRTDTWFFLVGGGDNLSNDTQPVPQPPPDPDQPGDARHVHGHPALSPDSPLIHAETCLEPAQKSGDWGELALCYMAMAKNQDPTLQLADTEVSAQNSMWYVPTYYGKVFHPRSLGHEVIREEIYSAWARFYGET